MDTHDNFSTLLSAFSNLDELFVPQPLLQQQPSPFQALQQQQIQQQQEPQQQQQQQQQQRLASSAQPNAQAAVGTKADAKPAAGKRSRSGVAASAPVKEQVGARAGECAVPHCHVGRVCRL